MKQCGIEMACADPESFLRGCPTLTTFYLLIYLFSKGRKTIQANITISGPSSANQSWHKIESSLGNYAIFQRIRTSIAMKPYFFRGVGVVRTHCPLLNPPMYEIQHNAKPR